MELLEAQMTETDTESERTRKVLKKALQRIDIIFSSCQGIITSVRCIPFIPAEICGLITWKNIYPKKAFGDTETKDPFPSFIAIVKDTE